MIIQRLFSSKAQKARRAEWDVKVSRDTWGVPVEEKLAKSQGRNTQRSLTVNLDKKGFRYEAFSPFSALRNNGNKNLSGTEI
jgi:hypothetical protein